MILFPDTACFRPVMRGQPDLRAGDVHLWKADLGAVSSEMRTTLSADEWVRSSRFHFVADRENYIATRALVRTILAGYVGDEPASLQFTRGGRGKPALADATTFLRFNLSHSGNLVLLAVTFAREVGVDLEAMRTEVHYEMLAGHYFSPEDQWALRIAPKGERCRKFFELWTRTEARLKAQGFGLDEAASRHSTPEITVSSFEPAEGYAAAIAVEGGAFDLSCFQWRN